MPIVFNIAQHDCAQGETTAAVETSVSRSVAAKAERLRH